MVHIDTTVNWSDVELIRYKLTLSLFLSMFTFHNTHSVSCYWLLSLNQPKLFRHPSMDNENDLLKLATLEHNKSFSAAAFWKFQRKTVESI